MIRCNCIFKSILYIRGQRYHVHVEKFPVDQQGGSWLSCIDLQTFTLTLHELHQSTDVVYHFYLGIGYF